MFNKGTHQSGNYVGGHLAGNNVDASVHYHAERRPTPVGRLLLKLREEQRDNVHAAERLDDLRYYEAVVDRERDFPLGLAKKLARAQRDDLVDKAMTLKERLSKKLQEKVLYASAQELFAFLLADVEARFEAYVAPIIARHATREQVDAAVQERVVEPVIASLEDNDLGLTAADVRGMVYLLTGNCHIDWR
jgi:hypothetical protein